MTQMVTAYVMQTKWLAVPIAMLAITMHQRQMTIALANTSMHAAFAEEQVLIPMAMVYAIPVKLKVA